MAWAKAIGCLGPFSKDLTWLPAGPTSSWEYHWVVLKAIFIGITDGFHGIFVDVPCLNNLVHVQDLGHLVVLLLLLFTRICVRAFSLKVPVAVVTQPKATFQHLWDIADTGIDVVNLFKAGGSDSIWQLVEGLYAGLPLCKLDLAGDSRC